ncbi:hypothetical protein [Novosphingobium sp.]|uniref:hypothetical protein n=1 Tax=Novosphingobium sp. TaxID=1874826 RepID=UPI003B51EC23
MNGTTMRGAALMLLCAVAGCSGAHDRIDCPAPERGTADTLHETPAQIAAAGAQLGHGDKNEIAEVAASLRARHAGASRDEIVNYLVTAYCPTINHHDELGKAAKRQALDSFSSRAERIIQQ